jgi:hypothetical protein
MKRIACESGILLYICLLPLTALAEGLCEGLTPGRCRAKLTSEVARTEIDALDLIESGKVEMLRDESVGELPDLGMKVPTLGLQFIDWHAEFHALDCSPVARTPIREEPHPWREGETKVHSACSNASLKKARSDRQALIDLSPAERRARRAVLEAWYKLSESEKALISIARPTGAAALDGVVPLVARVGRNAAAGTTASDTR